MHLQNKNTSKKFTLGWISSLLFPPCVSSLFPWWRGTQQPHRIWNVTWETAKQHQLNAKNASCVPWVKGRDRVLGVRSKPYPRRCLTGENFSASRTISSVQFPSDCKWTRFSWRWIAVDDSAGNRGAWEKHSEGGSSRWTACVHRGTVGLALRIVTVKAAGLVFSFSAEFVAVKPVCDCYHSSRSQVFGAAHLCVWTATTAYTQWARDSLGLDLRHFYFMSAFSAFMTKYSVHKSPTSLLNFLWRLPVHRRALWDKDISTGKCCSVPHPWTNDTF